jgi:hypothetical protein
MCSVRVVGHGSCDGLFDCPFSLLDIVPCRHGQFADSQAQKTRFLTSESLSAPFQFYLLNIFDKLGLRQAMAGFPSHVRSPSPADSGKWNSDRKVKTIYLEDPFINEAKLQARLHCIYDEDVQCYWVSGRWVIEGVPEHSVLTPVSILLTIRRRV